MKIYGDMFVYFHFFTLSLNPNCAQKCYFFLLGRRVEIFISLISLSQEYKKIQNVFCKVLKWVNLTWSLPLLHIKHLFISWVDIE